MDMHVPYKIPGPHMPHQAPVQTIPEHISVYVQYSTVR